jgi:opacity protein-like surface antigen
MSDGLEGREMMRRTILAAAAAFVAAAHGPTAGAAEPSATVQISQVQVAFLVSGNVGGGTLTFQGKKHDFSLGGIGYGGFGAQKIEARGEVYNLKRLEDFEGPYAQGRIGAVAGDAQVEGGIWLYNPAGVEIRLSSTREGYALSLGGDAVFIKLD